MLKLSYNFQMLEEVNIFGAGAFDDHIKVIPGSILTKVAWMVHFIIPMHLTGLNAEILMLKEVKVFLPLEDHI